MPHPSNLLSVFVDNLACSQPISQVVEPSQVLAAPSVIGPHKKRSTQKPLDKTWAEGREREERLFEDNMAKEVQPCGDPVSRSIMI
ncbi:hypothetical protein FRC02_003814 [Tulasnella sp. 418]|nr:hypothetical protein FRC02_003814 [Tulasnella sp. 418]